MDKKIIHELDVESLIALAKGAKEEVIMEKLSQAGQFIFDLKIKNGDTKISAAMIYYTYKQWRGWDQKRQSKPQFFKDFKRYFEPQRTAEGLVYLLNPKPFDLSEEAWWLMRKSIRDEKTKKSKRQSKTPKSTA